MRYVIWVLFFAMLHDTTTIVARAKQLTIQASEIDKINRLNRIIAEYQKDTARPLPMDQQHEYARLLQSFQGYLTQKKQEGYDVDKDEASYLKPFVEWKSFIVSDEPAQVDQDALDKKVASIYAQSAQEIQGHANNFVAVVHKQLEQAQSTEGLNDILTGAITTFSSQMVTIQQNALAELNQFLQQQGVEVDPLEPLQEQTDLIVGIKKLTNAADQRVVQMANAVKEDIVTKQLKKGLAASQQQRGQSTRRVAPAQPEADAFSSSAMDSVGRVMSTFLKNFGEKALEESGNKVVREVKGSVSDYVGQSLYGGGGSVADAKKKIEGSNSSCIPTFSSDTGMSCARAVSGVLDADSAGAQLLKKTIKFQYPVPINQQHQQVVVQKTAALSSEEKVFLKNRERVVQKVLQDHFQIDRPLRIAFCCSGGGNRAMIGTLGLLTAATRYNFLQATTYLVGLSGSTWMIAPWCYMHTRNILSADYQESLAQLKTMLTNELDYDCIMEATNICTPPSLTDSSQKAFAQNLSKRFAYNKPLSAVDVFGALVGNFALNKVGSTSLDVTWSSISQGIQKGTTPLPLCAAGVDIGTPTRSKYEFFETNPFQAGSRSLGYIPIWSLSSQFNRGIITDRLLEYPLSFYLGVYGSAFSLALNDVIDRIPQPTFNVLGQPMQIPVNNWIRNALDDTNRNIRADRTTFNHARFFNYSYGMPGSPLKNKEMFALFDAGIYINLPIPLLFERTERKVDVVILYDSNDTDIHSLTDALSYLRARGARVPDPKSITSKEFMEQPMLVINDPRNALYDASMPTFLYFRTPNQDVAKPPYNIDTKKYPEIIKPINNLEFPYITPNFKYPKKFFDNLFVTMEAIFESQVSVLKDVLRLVAQKKFKRGVVV